MGNNQSEDKTSQKKQKSGLEIKVFTWKKDSHSLYDYESQKQIKKDVILIQDTTNLVRIGEEVRQELPNEQEQVRNIHFQHSLIYLSKQRELLFQIQMKANRFYFAQDEMKSPTFDGLEKNSAWIVVKSLQNLNSSKSQGFHLSVDDYIKIGRVRFRVKEIKAKSDSSAMNSSSLTGNPENEAEFPGDNKQSCRICLSEMQTKKNKFISPCLCSGSVEYVHEECLQMWLKSKIHCKETHVHSFYSMKNLQCELCKFKFSDENSFVGKNLENVLISKPSCPYLMLEILSKEKSIVRGIQVIKFDKINKIILGRGSDSDIRISDISVSREHAVIKLEDNNFIIEDLKSKFGTLILVRHPIQLSSEFSKVEVQIGRSVCFFQLKKNSSSIFGACCSGKTQKKPNIFNTTAISRTAAGEQDNEISKNAPEDYEEERYNAHTQNNIRETNSPAFGSPQRQQRGGAIGTRHFLPDTMVNIFATQQQFPPQTSDDLNRVEDIHIENNENLN